MDRTSGRRAWQGIVLGGLGTLLLLMPQVYLAVVGVNTLWARAVVVREVGRLGVGDVAIGFEPVLGLAWLGWVSAACGVVMVVAAMWGVARRGPRR
ncbi:MAG: hypothetical protein R3B68_03740 [Phycisphaerales bacterium]